MNILVVIFGCLIANILLMAGLGYAGYRLFKKNETKVNEVKEEIDEIITQIKSIDFEELTKSINTATSSISSISESINEIKEKLDNIKLPWNE